MTAMASGETWFAVRCIIRLAEPVGETPGSYEERLTLWRTGSFGHAVTLAEADARSYAEKVTGSSEDFVGVAQTYLLDDAPHHGATVASLVRSSP